ncbi:tripartite tricarboxylate transporter substrate binding protein [Aeromicrobium sp. CTD01-1L150]|uniref:tripartite tricarboxylate transporter substrate binding protein n=1 Tax=Aeromicrobium sp. CTD01-1L150 TaxID=3341830 RepID=UPI0035C0183F
MNRSILTKATTAAAAAALLAACANSSNGDEDGEGGIPGRVSIVVPFGAGGSLDTNARIMAECLKENTDSNWVVENREGGGGTTGVNYVLDADSDGSTVGYISSSGIALTPLQVDDAEYAMEDILPLTIVTGAPSVIVTAGDSPHESLDDLLDSNGDDHTLATTGALGVYQLVASRLAEESDVRAVPFDDAAAATTAALGSNADAAILELSDSLLEYVNGGELRALGTGADEPVESIPDAETFGEAGHDLPISTNYGVFVGSRDLPQETQDALNEAFTKCAADDKVIDRIGEQFVLDPVLTTDPAEDLLQEARAGYEAALGE